MDVQEDVNRQLVEGAKVHAVSASKWRLLGGQTL